jgi:hypothetical protein
VVRPYPGDGQGDVSEGDVVRCRSIAGLSWRAVARELGCRWDRLPTLLQGCAGGGYDTLPSPNSCAADGRSQGTRAARLSVDILEVEPTTLEAEDLQTPHQSVATMPSISASILGSSESCSLAVNW